MTYDDIADYYAQLVENALVNRDSILARAYYGVLDCVDDVQGLTVCDVACGTGAMASILAKTAKHVVGTDIAGTFITLANERFDQDNLQFMQDDAQTLAKQDDARFDLVVSNMALMDIPDLSATCDAVNRILKPQGRFVFSITHPCFQAPHSDDVDTDEGIVRQITQYATEGRWKSRYPEGIRGQVGAHHRTMSTYINTLISTGFMLERIDEPVNINDGAEFPDVMIVSAKKAV